MSGVSPGIPSQMTFGILAGRCYEKDPDICWADRPLKPKPQTLNLKIITCCLAAEHLRIQSAWV